MNFDTLGALGMSFIQPTAETVGHDIKDLVVTSFVYTFITAMGS